MGRFDELLSTMQNPGEAGIPDSIYDDLRLAVGDDMAILAQERDNATTKIQELEGTVSSLRTQLYDLTVASGTEPETGGNDPDPDPDDDDDDDDTGEGIDSLFGDK